MCKNLSSRHAGVDFTETLCGKFFSELPALISHILLGLGAACFLLWMGRRERVAARKLGFLSMCALEIAETLGCQHACAGNPRKLGVLEHVGTKTPGKPGK